MNVVALVGRLARDPIQRMANTENGSWETANFTLAVERRKKSENEEASADFISCVAFGKRAEFVNKWLHQGTKVSLDGRIQTGSFTNKEGQKVYTTDVVVNNIEFAESKAASQSAVSNNNGGFGNIPDPVEDEGMPFK